MNYTAFIHLCRSAFEDPEAKSGIEDPATKALLIESFSSLNEDDQLAILHSATVPAKQTQTSALGQLVQITNQQELVRFKVWLFKLLLITAIIVLCIVIGLFIAADVLAETDILNGNSKILWYVYRTTDIFRFLFVTN